MTRRASSAPRRRTSDAPRRGRACAQINLVAHVSIKSPQVFNPGAPLKITMVDCGMKLNQLRCLCARGAQARP
jgi:carbamoylphosphate synthase small subunit